MHRGQLRWPDDADSAIVQTRGRRGDVPGGSANSPCLAQEVGKQSGRDLPVAHPAAAEKLLFLVFQRKTEGYLARVKAETVEERAAQFAAIREAEGCMAGVEKDGAELRIVEHHSPVADLLAAYPVLLNRLEQEMFGRVLRVPVKREQTVASGLYACVFRIKG